MCLGFRAGSQAWAVPIIRKVPRGWRSGTWMSARAPAFASQGLAFPLRPWMEHQAEVFLGRSVVFRARRLAHGLFSFLGVARRVKSKDESSSLLAGEQKSSFPSGCLRLRRCLRFEGWSWAGRVAR